MKDLTKPIAAALMGLGIAVVAIGGVNWQRADEGLASLDAIYRAQGVELSYNESGQLTDRGTTDGAEAILALLVDEWGFPVDQGDFDPADPQVNTPTEMMYQYATISYHVLNGTQTVTLDEDAEYEGETFAAGTYEVPIDGRYWTDFNRSHPLDRLAREQAWSGTVHGLLGELGAGVAADYQAGFAHFAAWRTALIGVALLLGGAGLYTVASREPERILFSVPERETVTTA